MEAMSTTDFISPEGFYSLGYILSKEDVVSAIINKYGTPPRHISTKEAMSLLVSNTPKAMPPGKERIEFIEAGIRFCFIDEWLDVKSLPLAAVEMLEKMKEVKSPGYSYAKREFATEINQLQIDSENS